MIINALSYIDVIMSAVASQITGVPIAQPLDQVNIKKAPCHWPFLGEFTGDRIPQTKTSNAENVPIWWRHHVTSDMKLPIWQQRPWKQLSCRYYRMLGAFLLTENSRTSIDVTARITRYAHLKQWDVITHPRPDFNGCKRLDELLFPTENNGCDSLPLP